MVKAKIRRLDEIRFRASLSGERQAARWVGESLGVDVIFCLWCISRDDR